MNNFWCHDVPKNINKAFQQNDPDEDSLFRFSAKNLSQNNYPPLNYQPCISNQNWKTLNNLSTASNYITSYNKRKILNEDDDLLYYQPPNKQNVTEAKVMEKFNLLKLDETEDFNDDIVKNGLNNEIDFEFEENNNLENDFEIKKIEIADSVQEFWDCDDVLTKMFQNEKEKASKALVLWKPRISYLNIDKTEKNKTKIIEKNDDYTVFEEIECDEENESKEKNSVKIIEIEDTLNTEEMEF